MNSQVVLQLIFYLLERVHSLSSVVGSVAFRTQTSQPSLFIFS